MVSDCLRAATDRKEEFTSADNRLDFPYNGSVCLFIMLSHRCGSHPKMEWLWCLTEGVIVLICGWTVFLDTFVDVTLFLGPKMK